MDYKRYSENLEAIINGIKMKEETRALVDYLVADAKKKCAED